MLNRWPIHWAVLPSAALSVWLAVPAVQADGLEEVIVSAQRRDQKLQDVPIVVQVLSADLIQKVASEDLRQVSRLVPGLVVSGDSPTQPHFALRGIGASDFGVGTDPAVGVYVDGVYAARSGASFLAFNDIERIEVLRGPQGTLLGRSSAAGAISIITKKPTDAFEGSVDLRIGNEGKHRLEGMLNVPLTDAMALRFNGVTSQADGYLTDAATGRKLNPERSWAGRIAYRWNIDANTELQVAWNHDSVEQLARPAIGLVPIPKQGAVPPPVTTTTNGSTWLNPLTTPIYNDVVGNEESRRLEEFVVMFSKRFGAVDFHSTSEGRAFHTVNREDEDGTNRLATYLDTANVEHNTSWYQEFKFSGKTARTDWVAGASYSSEHALQHSDTHLYTDSVDTALNDLGLQAGGLFGPTGDGITVAGLPVNLRGFPWRETMFDDGRFKYLGVFGDTIWHLTDRLNLTTGVRYSHVQKDFAWLAPYRDSPELDALLGALSDLGILGSNGLPPLQAYQFNLAFRYGQTPGSAASFATSNSWSDFSPRLVLDYKFNPDTMAYLSIAKGFTPGGFDSVQINGRYDNETVWNYELGLKTTLPDAHVVLDGAVYAYQYKNKQDLTLDTTSGAIPVYIVNSTDQKARGVDIALSWQPLTPLTFGLTAAYIDATYAKFISQYKTNLAGAPTGEPTLSFSTNVDYAMSLANGSRLNFFLAHSYRGAGRCNADSVATRSCLPNAAFAFNGAQNITDMTVHWRSANQRWGASVYVNNLLDKRYIYGVGGIGVSPLGTPVASVNAPRRYGVDLHAAF